MNYAKYPLCGAYHRTDNKKQPCEATDVKTPFFPGFFETKNNGELK